MEVLKINNEEKAKLILADLENVMDINWNFQEMFLKQLKKTLCKIDELEVNEVL